MKWQPFLSPYRIGHRPGQQGAHLPLGTRTELRICWCKIRASRSNIIFGTWNVRTLRMAGKFEELTYQTRRYGWNILGLSDVWWKNFDETSTLEGHKWYFSGKEENHEQVGNFLFKRTSWKLSWPAVPSQAVLSPSAWVQVHWTSQLYRPIRPYHGLW